MSAKFKKIVFYLIIPIIPLLFFVTLEFLLAIFHYGDQFKLVRIVEQQGKKYYQLNKDVARRYFGRLPAPLVPQLYPQKFEYQKSAQTLRIFLLGGSTMAGFPYELNARINSLLQDRLEKYYPEKRIEVINVGLSAINSFSVLDFTRELVKYDPDLFVLYMGHNEFYGAYGVASLEGVGTSPVVMGAVHFARKFRVFWLMRSLVQKIRSIWQHPDPPGENRSLMAAMAQKQSIPMGSKAYRTAKNYFSENLGKILDIAQKNSVPILVSTLVSNLRDQPPFQSLFSDSLSRESQQRWQEHFQQGKKLTAAKDYVKALSAYERAELIDASPAVLHYEIGNLFLAVGDSVHAKQSYRRARDLDPIRFRAPSEFNQLIKSLCRKNQTPLLDLEAVFSAFSKFHIIGNELVSEHLHPNFRGYFLMAKAFARAIVEYDFFHLPASNADLPDNDFLEISKVTILDRAIGDVKIQRLTSGWPYQHPVSIIKYKSPATRQAVEAIVAEYQQQRISWNEAHYRLADYFAGKKMTDLAVKEYQSVIKVVPDNYFPYFKIGNLYFVQNLPDRAETWFKKARDLNPDAAFIYAKLGMVNIVTNHLRQAIDNFQHALELESQRPQLSQKEKVYAHYYLAACFIKFDQLDAAKAHLRKLLAIEPKHEQAQQLLSLMEQNKKIHIQF